MSLASLVSLVQFQPFDSAEEHPAMGMDDISKQLLFVLTGLPSNACSIELSEIMIVVWVNSPPTDCSIIWTFPSTDSCHCWIIWGIVGVRCIMSDYINTGQTVLCIRLLDYCAS